jgi:hypothetical protein
MWAEASACALITARRPDWRQASFEFCSTQHVLALTMMLADADRVTGIIRTADMRIAHLLADDVEWAIWCQWQLDHPARGLTVADTSGGRAAWRWLTCSRLLAGSLHELCPACAATPSSAGVGIALGVALGRGVIEDGHECR